MKNCCFTYYGELFSEGGECPEAEIGSLQIHRGIDQELYSDQATAETYLGTAIDGTCSKVYLDIDNDVLFFDVPQGTFTNQYFLASTSAYIVQLNNLLQYADLCFGDNGGNNIINGLAGNDITFGDGCFASSFGNNYISSAIAGNEFFQNSSGNNTIDYCEALENAFFGSSGNNTIAQIIAGINAFKQSYGNNKIVDLFATNSCFELSSGNNTIGDGTFGESAFLDAASSLNTITNIIDASDNFGKNYQGNFLIKANIGATDSDDLTGTATFFDSGSSANLIVQLAKLTSNGGNPEGDLARAVINGATVNYILI
jgi:hypothetical protein